MTGPIHTYGPSCLLEDEAPDLTNLQSAPEIRTQFFYISSLPIDDPLAPLPPPANPATGTERLPPKPFSARDNIALEDAWRDLWEVRKTKNAGSNKSRSNTLTRPSGIAVPGHDSESNVEPHRKMIGRDSSLVDSRGSTLSNPPSFPEELPSHSHRGHIAFASSSAGTQAKGIGKETHAGPSANDELKQSTAKGIDIDRKRARSSSINESSTAKRRSSSPQEADNAHDVDEEMGILRANRSRDASISGSPFIRAPISQSQTPLGRSFESTSSKEGGQDWHADVRTSAPRSAPKPSGLRATVSLDQLTQDSQDERTEEPSSQSKIPVGVSRLHLVELPNLKVRDIYAYFCALPTPFLDETNILESTSRYIERGSSHLVLQEYNVSRRDRTCKQVGGRVCLSQAMDRHLAR
jgi:hypothetical protein